MNGWMGCCWFFFFLHGSSSSFSSFSVLLLVSEFTFAVVDVRTKVTFFWDFFFLVLWVYVYAYVCFHQLFFFFLLFTFLVWCECKNAPNCQTQKITTTTAMTAAAAAVVVVCVGGSATAYACLWLWVGVCMCGHISTNTNSLHEEKIDISMCQKLSTLIVLRDGCKRERERSRRTSLHSEGKWLCDGLKTSAKSIGNQSLGLLLLCSDDNDDCDGSGMLQAYSASITWISYANSREHHFPPHHHRQYATICYTVALPYANQTQSLWFFLHVQNQMFASIDGKWRDKTM